MSSFDTNITVSNDNYSGTQDLADIFPTFEIKSEAIKGTASDLYGSKTLSNNNTNTTDYHVFATYYYSEPDGSNTTYNKFQASSSANSIIIYDKKATSFSWSMRKSDGQTWNGGISFLVIYNTPSY